MLFISDTNHFILFLQYVFYPVKGESSDRSAWTTPDSPLPCRREIWSGVLALGSDPEGFPSWCKVADDKPVENSKFFLKLLKIS